MRYTICGMLCEVSKTRRLLPMAIERGFHWTCRTEVRQVISREIYGWAFLARDVEPLALIYIDVGGCRLAPRTTLEVRYMI